MNLGKDNGNQSLSDFDNMTFDDMTFDDEPLQGGIQQSNNNQFIQPVRPQQVQPVQPVQPVQNIGMQQNAQQQMQDMGMQQPVQNNGKQKKIKKEKTPKPPKAPKPPKQPKRKKVRGQQTMNPGEMVLGNQLMEDEMVEQKSSKLKIIIPIVVVAIAVIIGIVVLNLPKYTDKHVTLANNTPAIQDTTQNEGGGTGIVVGENTTEKEETETPSMTVLELNKPMKIAVVVNTKIEGDTEYTDHQTYLKVEYSNFVSGYDNVKTYLDEYNSTATNKINLPSKDDFYASSVGNDLVMYEVTISVPEDFPTNDAKHGYTGLKPKFDLVIKGTEKEDSLITQLYEFAIPSVYFIGSDTSSFTIGSTYTLRYMTTMPMELKADGYELFFHYNNDGVTQIYGLTSLDIPANADVIEVDYVENADETTSEDAEDTDNIITDNALDAISN